MTRPARLLAALFATALLAGCGDSKVPTPATDPESIRKLEELQKKGAQGEK
jgi:hypothetical protein